MKTTILLFAVLSIIANYPHTYWALDYISNVKEKFKFRVKGTEFSPKKIQNVIFCLIISTSILFLVLTNKEFWAMAACVVEMVINAFYVHSSYEERYKRIKDEKKKEAKPRQLKGAYFFAILMPFCIYVFSYLYMEL